MVISVRLLKKALLIEGFLSRAKAQRRKEWLFHTLIQQRP
jgi:hypothetical protein